MNLNNRPQHFEHTTNLNISGRPICTTSKTSTFKTSTTKTSTFRPKTSTGEIIDWRNNRLAKTSTKYVSEEITPTQTEGLQRS